LKAYRKILNIDSQKAKSVFIETVKSCKY
ncbi:helicase loading protein, partial [Escherichia coli]|nr:helicase loading protein [Escherichia coli]